MTDKAKHGGTTDIATEADSLGSNRDTNGYWQPPQAITSPALFTWPPQPLGVLKWIFGFPGYLWPWTTLYGLIAVITWFYFQPDLAVCKEVQISWIMQIFVRNQALLILVVGGWHLHLYIFKAQGLQYKYTDKWLSNANRKFLWGSQLRDNVFWSCVSGGTIWTAYEVLLMWAYANGIIPYVDWRTQPVYCVLLFGAIPMWRLFHFYWVHRLTHWKPLYKAAHYLHHKNINVGPWSGLAMHPIEHILYFSCILLHWVVPSHPLHMLFNVQHAALTPAQGHVGFDKLILHNKAKVPAASFFHQLHHRYFECNYGEVDFPFDKWFGTYHDGTPQAHTSMRDKRQQAHHI